MKKIILTIVLMFTACAPSAGSIQTAIAQTQAVWTAVPTQTPYPTQTALVVTKIVTPIFTFTPVNTATITNTPTATIDPLKQLKGPGFYLVNVDIAPGVWRSTGTGSECYWEVTTKTGDIIANHFGQSGGTAYIPPDAFQVNFQKCGTWEYLSPP